MAKPQPCYRELYVENYKWKSLDDNLLSWFGSAFALSLMLAALASAPDDLNYDRPFLGPFLFFLAISFGYVIVAKLIGIATYHRRKITGAVFQLLDRAEERLVPLLISHATALKPEVREESYDQLRYLLLYALVERIPLDNMLNTNQNKTWSIASNAFNSRAHLYFTTEQTVRFACQEIGLENKLAYWLDESCSEPQLQRNFAHDLLSASRYIICSSAHADKDLVALRSS